MTQPATIPLFTAQTKSQPQIRDDILRTLANHLRAIGVATPNTGPGSDYYAIATALANEVAVGIANGVIAVNNLMPDTAGGAFLDRWLAIFGLSRAGATQSAGVISPVFSLVTGYTNVPTGAQLIDSAGLRYQVSVGGLYGPGSAILGQPPALTVPVTSIDAGSGTDHANGDQLTWVTAPTFIGPNASVGTAGGTDGLSGGNNSELGNDEPPRARLISTLQNPPGGGNWSEVNQWIQQSSPNVQAGFCYPALIGPATVFGLAVGAAQVAGPFSSTSKNRTLPAALMSGKVIPYVQGKYSTRAAVIISTPASQPADVALYLAIPSAPTASPAGPGGGWVDGSPWPSTGSLVGAPFVPTVIGVTNSKQFQVLVAPNSGSPVPGVSSIAYLDPTNWTLYTATVVSSSVSGPFSNIYSITIDTPWPGISTNYFVFPQSLQQQNYVSAALQGFANLGPGEWTSNVSVLTRAFRHPSPQLSWPSSLDANFLRVMENAGTEVATAAFLFRSLTTPTVPAVPTITASDPLLLLSAPPNILVPRNIGLYQS